ncbi:hypothetical protein [Leptolyngbya sp. FACHB-261]|uniref:hypothetical protein n=1 Tax=Leptolyngbya sp. FACHB-261 TaxID=2692806 RepID=UPI0016848D92|nr:hypothetical protein [Leptolyngbya sp. FACHB-261]MBD2101243.1 hypothetical protein [Leptolyngbya sp. FACHB-261]
MGKHSLTVAELISCLRILSNSGRAVELPPDAPLSTFATLTAQVAVIPKFGVETLHWLPSPWPVEWVRKHLERSKPQGQTEVAYQIHYGPDQEKRSIVFGWVTSSC